MPSYSPLRISDQSLNLPTSMMEPGMRLAKGGEPVYLPWGHPASEPPPQRPPPPPSMPMDLQHGNPYPKPRMELQPLQSSMESPRELWESSEPGDAMVQHTAHGGCWSATSSAPQALDPYHVSVLAAGAALQPPLFDARDAKPPRRPPVDLQYHSQLQPMRSSESELWENTEPNDVAIQRTTNGGCRGWPSNMQPMPPVDRYHHPGMLNPGTALQPMRSAVAPMQPPFHAGPPLQPPLNAGVPLQPPPMNAGAALQPPLFAPCGPPQRPQEPPSAMQPPLFAPCGPQGDARSEDDHRHVAMTSQSSAVYPHPQAGMLPLATSKAEELFDVVSRNDIPELRALLDSKVDVNECTAKGSHVLFRAVIKARELDMVHMLLNAGADARCTDEKGNQVMHFWARATVGRNHLLDMGRALLLAGADINAQRFNDGMSPLHHVVVGHNNRRGWLDFHKALMLVRHGANIYLRTHVGQLPLSLVSVDGRAATKKLIQLLQCGFQEGRTDWPRCDHVGCAWCL